MDDIQRVLSCAERHLSDDAIVSAACDCLDDLLFLPFRKPPGDGRNANESALKEMRRSLDANRGAWNGKSFVNYSANKVDLALKEVYRQDTGENQEMLSQFLFWFLTSNDAQGAVPHMVRWISEYHLWESKAGILSTLIRCLQLYVGPLDVPKSSDVVAQKKSQQWIITWWVENGGKKPAAWLLQRLASRGYATDNPADQDRTSAAIIQALKKGSDSERYAAARWLAYVLPDGGGIPTNDDGVATPRSKELTGAPRSALEYVDELVLCRALQWRFLDRDRYRWSDNVQTYIEAERKGDKFK